MEIFFTLYHKIRMKMTSKLLPKRFPFLWNWILLKPVIRTFSMVMLVGLLTSASRRPFSATPENIKNIQNATAMGFAGPELAVTTTLMGVSCDKIATYQVQICNNGDVAATAVIPNLIPENSGFVLKSVTAGPGYAILNAGYHDPGDTQTEAYDGYGFGISSNPCTSLSYQSPCSPFTYGTFSTGPVTSGVFGFPPSTSGSGVPKDAIILSASLNVHTLTINATVNAGIIGTMGGIKRPDLAGFSTTNHPGDLYFLYPTSKSVPAITTEMNVTTVAQELVNQGGWTENSMMAFFWLTGRNIIIRNATDAVSRLDISYIAPATIEPGACATLTYEYDVSNVPAGTYQMSAHVNTATTGTSYLPNTDFSANGTDHLNGYNGADPANSLDDTVIPESYLPVLNWTCPSEITTGSNILISATASNVSSIALSSETDGTIVNEGSTEAPAAEYTPTADDITNGYATIAVTATSPNGCNTTVSCRVTINTILPVKLINFDVARSENNVVLNWKTISETNSDRFEIQRSRNGKTWNTIGSVAAHFESVTVQGYHFSDKAPQTGSSLYRLKMIDRDNTFSYSRMQQIDFGRNNGISVYPNPVAEELTISADLQDISEISLVHINGQKTYVVKPVGQSIPVRKFPNGIYLLKIIYKSGETEIQKILIQH
jgi:uncharacterized repeat protein (TIGR01451 family)